MLRQAKAPGSSSDRLLLWTERVLVGAGVALLMWVAAVMADGVVAQWLAREALARLPHAIAGPAAATPSADDVPDPKGTAAITSRPVVLAHGAPIGELSIPRVELSAVVLHGSDARTLRRGPGHIETTALPGHGGNMAIAGHRDSFFRPIRNVRLGDDVFLDTAEGRFRYRVSSLDIVGPTDLEVLKTTATPTLTLITCYPFWLAGPAPNRFIVRAVEVERPLASGAAPRPTVVSSVVGFEGSPELPGARDPVARRPGEQSGQPVRVPAADLSDDVLVKRAIERFRVTYNARLARRPDPYASGPVSFDNCALSLSPDVATATCVTVALPAAAAGTWEFILHKDADAWEITSVEPPPS